MSDSSPEIRGEKTCNRKDDDTEYNHRMRHKSRKSRYRRSSSQSERDKGKTRHRSRSKRETKKKTSHKHSSEEGSDDSEIKAKQSRRLHRDRSEDQNCEDDRLSDYERGKDYDCAGISDIKHLSKHRKGRKRSHGSKNMHKEDNCGKFDAEFDEVLSQHEKRKPKESQEQRSDNTDSRYRHKHINDDESVFMQSDGRNVEADRKKYHKTSFVTGCDAPDERPSTAKQAENEGEHPDYDFDFSRYKPSLNRIFFRDHNLISRGSKEYEDFWAFLRKYQAYKKKKAAESEIDGNRKERSRFTSKTSSGFLDTPKKYDPRYRINFSVLSRDAEDFIKKGRLMDYEVDKDLTRERVQQFSGILLHYLDFCQKQKFQKLRKIQQDQKNLPIYQYKEKIMSMIQQHQIVVVAGDTGCGKSTQMPQYLLEAGFDKIACTQPRRIACISLSKRVGYETLNEYGSRVAFQVRFEKTKDLATRILFLTEGLLLRQMSSDQLLSKYSVIVIDEVHERHIHTDFLLGVLKCVLKMRKDLKLVLMSATINISLFSSYFGGAPVIKVPGRLYPIELEYCPLNKNTEVYSAQPKRLDPTPYIRILQRIDSKYPPTERGDLLIFLSGMTEIMTVVEAVRLYAQQMKQWIVLPLHSALSVEEQEKVFDYPPTGVRKCIVSTNIAETSVTIDGVRFVVDSGKVKEMSFDPRCKMQRLKEFWISRASSEQRKGRAGRTGPGVCFRLYSESDYDEFQAYSTPEVQRVPLDSLVLQLISMGLPNVRKFPFLEAPDMSTLENSVSFLKEQGALTVNETLTPIGQMLSMLPVDVVTGKMLIMGSVFHMVDPVLSIAAAMSVQSPFTAKSCSDHDAIAARRSLESEHGDPLTLLNAFDEWIRVKAVGQGTRKWCRRRHLEEQRFYEMTKMKRQFRDLLKEYHLLEEESIQQQYFTSEERRQRHGERKRLRHLKREHQQESKRPKMLKIEDEELAVSDGEEKDQGDDINDLEFRLTHDLNQLHEKSSHSLTLGDINLLKTILCSGIFPQVAIADDCNLFKSDSEQVFHTKNKLFNLVHQTSVFAYHPDLLKPKELPEKHSGPTELRGQFKMKHELLAYGSLLETNNKPYLVNCMRVPALQTLTLFTNSIDTNTDCTRIVCDDWLEVRFPDADCAEQVLSSIICLRSTWQKLLQLRLEDTFERQNEEHETSPRARQLERVLSRKLAEFLDSQIPYSLRRVLSAELQHLYVGAGHNNKVSGGLKMFGMEEADVQEHPVKGGYQINSYLTYNCLLDEASASMWGQYTSHMQRHWTCPHCCQTMVVSVLERLQHQDICQKEASLPTGGIDGQAGEEKVINPLAKSYHCKICDKTLNLTASEILKHRKSHADSKAEAST